MTLHKAKGSRFSRIIIALQKGKIVNRTWLYTAITRAENEIHIIGSGDDFVINAKATFNSHRRKSYLAEPLGIKSRLNM